MSTVQVIRTKREKKEKHVHVWIFMTLLVSIVAQVTFTAATVYIMITIAFWDAARSGLHVSFTVCLGVWEAVILISNTWNNVGAVVTFTSVALQTVGISVDTRFEPVAEVSATTPGENDCFFQTHWPSKTLIIWHACLLSNIHVSTTGKSSGCCCLTFIRAVGTCLSFISAG